MGDSDNSLDHYTTRHAPLDRASDTPPPHPPPPPHLPLIRWEPPVVRLDEVPFDPRSSLFMLHVESPSVQTGTMAPVASLVGGGRAGKKCSFSSGQINKIPRSDCYFIFLDQLNFSGKNGEKIMQVFSWTSSLLFVLVWLEFVKLWYLKEKSKLLNSIFSLEW